MKIVPFGYAHPGSQQLLEVFLQDPMILLIDCRFKPYCHWNTYWNGTSLKEKYSHQYHFAGAYLGNVNYGKKDVPIQLVNPEIGLRGIQTYLKEGKTLVLLCACKDYVRCHRRTICELVKHHLPESEIEHPFYISGTYTMIRCYCCGLWGEVLHWKGQAVYCDTCEEDTSGVYRSGTGRKQCAYCKAYDNNHWNDPRPTNYLHVYIR